MKQIKITTEYIKLQQFLKLSTVVTQGSDAKIFIEQGLVKVNGIIATERGKKLRNGDIIEIEDYGKYQVLGE